MTLDELIAHANAGPTDGLLDNLVHDSKASEASDINNDGVAAQIRYLASFGFSVYELRRYLGLAGGEARP